MAGADTLGSRREVEGSVLKRLFGGPALQALHSAKMLRYSLLLSVPKPQNTSRLPRRGFLARPRGFAKPRDTDVSKRKGMSSLSDKRSSIEQGSRGRNENRAKLHFNSRAGQHPLAVVMLQFPHFGRHVGPLEDSRMGVSARQHQFHPVGPGVDQGQQLL